MMLRLDKYLTEMRCGTRSQVKKEISKGAVAVNGTIEKCSDRKVDSEKDEIVFKGEPVVYEQFEYFMLNKPSGVVSATEDKRERTVLDLIKESKRNDLFPAGRLDKDTEGLLLITNDGKLSHRLLSPKKHVDKVYYAKVKGIVNEQDVQIFRTGVDIGDEKLTMPAKLQIISVHNCQSSQRSVYSEIHLTIKEGRFHQVKRMFRAVGKEVVYLKRIKFGSLTLDSSLQPGEYRKLTEEEVKQLC